MNIDAGLYRKIEKSGQQDVLRYWDELDESGRKHLADQLAEIDFDELPTLIRGYVLQRPVTEIPDEAFRGCISLQTVTMSADVTKIGAYAFSGCSKLKTVRYAGDEAAWAQIDVSSEGNDLFAAAKVEYNAE